MPKVSIIAPAYQAEGFIQRYIDCVLNFKHKNLELIIVNDGSCDKTHEIILSNKEKIESSGIDFKYIPLSENKGQANALDIGLKHVTGEYLSWHDVDDIFYPECISRSLEVIQTNPECKIVYSKAIKVDEKLLKPLESKNGNKLYLPAKEFKHKNLFKDYILGKDVIFGPMRFVETKALFDVLKDKSIYISVAGQNWQMFLPMTYKYKWVYIDEVLSEYVVRQESHSHSKKTASHKKEHKKILLNTIDRMKIGFFEKAYFKTLVSYRYFRLDLKNIFKK